jgi:hypothetical protein
MSSAAVTPDRRRAPACKRSTSSLGTFLAGSRGRLDCLRSGSTTLAGLGEARELTLKGLKSEERAE